MNNLDRRTIVLQASGEYLMNHIADVMEVVQDKLGLNEDQPDEEMLVTIEAQANAIAEEPIGVVSTTHFVHVAWDTSIFF